jgi:mannitol/fructose-specific phosphotransferase system IIA component (Ntr-type)
MQALLFASASAASTSGVSSLDEDGNAVDDKLAEMAVQVKDLVETMVADGTKIPNTSPNNRRTYP